MRSSRSVGDRDAIVLLNVPGDPPIRGTDNATQQVTTITAQ
jgi:hypothetical protein